MKANRRVLGIVLKCGYKYVLVMLQEIDGIKQLKIEKDKKWKLSRKQSLGVITFLTKRGTALHA